MTARQNGVFTEPSCHGDGAVFRFGVRHIRGYFFDHDFKTVNDVTSWPYLIMFFFHDWTTPVVKVAPHAVVRPCLRSSLTSGSVEEITGLLGEGSTFRMSEEVSWQAQKYWRTSAASVIARCRDRSRALAFSERITSSSFLFLFSGSLSLFAKSQRR